MQKTRGDLVSTSVVTGGQEGAARSRNQMRADWDRVRALLASGARKHRDGRDVWQVWADLVLENPPVEYERAMKLFPGAVGQPEGHGSVHIDARALYLQAVIGANKPAEPVTIDEPLGVQQGFTGDELVDIAW